MRASFSTTKVLGGQRKRQRLEKSDASEQTHEGMASKMQTTQLQELPENSDDSEQEESCSSRDSASTPANSTTTTTTSAAAANNKLKPSYKHIPHSQKPPHLVAKRNARERRRVQAVNQAFYKLRKSVPIENRNKRVSKVKTLQRAIDYIKKLERILAEDESQAGGSAAGLQLVEGSQVSREPAIAISSDRKRSQVAGKQKQQPLEALAVNELTTTDGASAGQATGGPKARRGRRPANNKQRAEEAGATGDLHQLEPEMARDLRSAADPQSCLLADNNNYAAPAPAPPPQPPNEFESGQQQQQLAGGFYQSCDSSSYGRPVASHHQAVQQQQPAPCHYYLSSSSGSLGGLVTSASGEQQQQQLAGYQQSPMALHHQNSHQPGSLFEISSSSSSSSSASSANMTGLGHDYSQQAHHYSQHCSTNMSHHSNQQQLLGGRPSQASINHGPYLELSVADSSTYARQITLSWPHQHNYRSENQPVLENCGQQQLTAAGEINDKQQQPLKSSPEYSSPTSKHSHRVTADSTSASLMRLPLPSRAAGSVAQESPLSDLCSNSSLASNSPSATLKSLDLSGSISSSSATAPVMVAETSKTSAGSLVSASESNKSDRSSTTTTGAANFNSNTAAARRSTSSNNNNNNSNDEGTSPPTTTNARVAFATTAGTTEDLRPGRQQQVNNYGSHPLPSPYGYHGARQQPDEQLKLFGCQQPQLKSPNTPAAPVLPEARHESRSSSVVSSPPSIVSLPQHQQLPLVGGGDYLANNNLHGNNNHHRPHNAAQLFHHRQPSYYQHQNHQHQQHQRNQQYQQQGQQGQQYFADNQLLGQQQHIADHLSDHHNHNLSPHQQHNLSSELSTSCLSSSATANATSSHLQQSLSANTIELTTSNINQQHSTPVNRLQLVNGSGSIPMRPAHQNHHHQYTILPL